MHFDQSIHFFGFVTFLHKAYDFLTIKKQISLFRIFVKEKSVLKGITYIGKSTDTITDPFSGRSGSSYPNLYSFPARFVFLILQKRTNIPSSGGIQQISICRRRETFFLL